MREARYKEPDDGDFFNPRQIAPYNYRSRYPVPYQRYVPIHQPQQGGIFISTNMIFMMLGVLLILGAIYLTSGRSGNGDIAVMVLQQQLQETQDKLDTANQQIAIMSKEMGAHEQQLLQTKDDLYREQIRKAEIEAQLKEASKGTFTRILEGLFGK